MIFARPPRIELLTLLAGLAGALVFHALALPAPWLSGAMVGIVGLMVAGFRPTFPEPLRDSGMLLAGCATGSSITPEMLAALKHYPVSLAMLVLTTLGVTYAGAFLLRRLFHWDPWSAFFGSVPGALSVVIASVGERGGDMARVVSAQAFRLFILVALLPSLIMRAVTVHAAPALLELAPLPFALLAACGLVLAWLLARLRVMAPWFIGGMVAAGALHLGGILQGTPPPPVGNFAMLLVGIFAASRMAGTSAKTLKALWLPCLSLLLCSVTVALLGGYITHVLSGVPIANALIAFAPGGLEAMVVLGLSLGLDPLYVTSHHVGRFVLLSVLLPLLARRVPGAAAYRARQATRESTH
jgi:membrane AbrB-like protein